MQNLDGMRKRIFSIHFPSTLILRQLTFYGTTSIIWVINWTMSNSVKNRDSVIFLFHIGRKHSLFTNFCSCIKTQAFVVLGFLLATRACLVLTIALSSFSGLFFLQSGLKCEMTSQDRLESGQRIRDEDDYVAIKCINCFFILMVFAQG